MLLLIYFEQNVYTKTEIQEIVGYISVLCVGWTVSLAVQTDHPAFFSNPKPEEYSLCMQAKTVTMISGQTDLFFPFCPHINFTPGFSLSTLAWISSNAIRQYLITIKEL